MLREMCTLLRRSVKREQLDVSARRMVHYKLYYFEGRAVGEVIRQLFHLAKQDFEDVRINKGWPAQKEKMPFGQLPVLEVDGKQLSQSAAIARYVAKQFGYAGKNDWDAAHVDALVDQWKDFYAEIKPYMYTRCGLLTGDLDQLKQDVLIPAVKKHFAYFSKYLKQNPSGFLVGDSVTFADLLISEWVAMFGGDLLDEFPEFKQHSEKVRSIPELKQWIEVRPETAF